METAERIELAALAPALAFVVDRETPRRNRETDQSDQQSAVHQMLAHRIVRFGERAEQGDDQTEKRWDQRRCPRQ